MRAIALLVLVLLLLAGCSDGDADPAATGSPTPSGSTSSAAPVPQEVTLEVAAVGVYPVSQAFDPGSLQVPAGSWVHATLRNEDQTPTTMHDWVVDGIPGAESDMIGPGEETAFDFMAPAEPGEYAFYCSVSDHRQRGMEGTLTVTAA